MASLIMSFFGWLSARWRAWRRRAAPGDPPYPAVPAPAPANDLRPAATASTTPAVTGLELTELEAQHLVHVTGSSDFVLGWLHEDELTPEERATTQRHLEAQGVLNSGVDGPLAIADAYRPLLVTALFADEVVRVLSAGATASGSIARAATTTVRWSWVEGEPQRLQLLDPAEATSLLLEAARVPDGDRGTPGAPTTFDEPVYWDLVNSRLTDGSDPVLAAYLRADRLLHTTSLSRTPANGRARHLDVTDSDGVWVLTREEGGRATLQAVTAAEANRRVAAFLAS